MKLKHFSGYGSVQAKKIWAGENGGFRKLRVFITGNHEQGLEPYYYDVGLIKQWIIDRFDKETKGISASNMDISYTVDNSYSVIDGEVMETAMYDIEYQHKYFPFSYKKFTL